MKEGKTQAIIICPQCKAEHKLADMIHRRKYASDVEAIGLLCPNCDNFTHSFFETPGIVEKRQQLNAALERYKIATGKRRTQRWAAYQTSKQVFERLFKDTQERLGRKYGVAKSQQTDSCENSADMLE